MKKFHIIRKAYLWLMIGGVVLLGAWLLFFMNARFSEEFTGGVKITVADSLNTTQVQTSLETYLTEQGYTDNKISLNVNNGQTAISIVTNIQDDEKVAALSEGVQNFLVSSEFISSPDQIIEQSITGPSVGDYMKNTAIKALIIGLILMAIYMMFAFSTIRNYVAPSTLALVTVATMIFDISIPAGAYGFWMMINPTISVDTVFIIAILASMGYSINDTIIIFDRIRENIQLKGHEKGILFGNIFEKSLRQTMRRSVMTSISTLLVLVAMYILGSGIIKNFSFVVGIGVIVGTFSSLFIAGPMAYILLGKYKKERRAMMNQHNNQEM